MISLQTILERNGARTDPEPLMARFKEWVPRASLAKLETIRGAPAWLHG